LEGNGRGSLEVVFRYLPREIKEKHENHRLTQPLSGRDLDRVPPE
jgi:hypothetical protein